MENAQCKTLLGVSIIGIDSKVGGRDSGSQRPITIVGLHPQVLAWYWLGIARDNGPKLLKCELGQFDELSTFDCTFVGANADAGPVGAGNRIRPWIAIFYQGTDKLVHKVRM